MTRIVTGLFDTRREAEMAVEKLVQEYHLDRSRIRAHAAGADNTSGTVVSGADADDAAAGEAPDGVRGDRIAVSVEIEATDVDHLRAAFQACGVKEVDGDDAVPTA